MKKTVEESGFKLLYLFKDDFEEGGPAPRLDVEAVRSDKNFVNSIKDNGQEDPIDVYPSPLGNGKYRIIDGHRRKLVCFDLLKGIFPGGPGIWVISKDRTELEAYETAFILNQKCPVSAQEIAHYCLELKAKYPEFYPTYDSLVKKLGFSDSVIAQVVAACKEADSKKDSEFLSKRKKK